MGRPNIFDYATSELSQDAFIAYLLSYGMEKYKNDYPNEYHLARKFLSACGIDEPVIEIKKQYCHIDILVLTKRFALIIEDKTNTDEHGEQIKRYISLLQKDENYKSKQIVACYFKTGDYISYDKSKCPVHCKAFKWREMMALLEELPNKDLIFESFYQRLICWKKEIEACDTQDIYSWTKRKWFDFLYNKIGEEKIGIGYVPNPQGGFYACWFSWTNLEKIEKYKQIEIHLNKEGKTDLVNLCYKCASLDKKKIDDSYKTIMQVWQKESGYSRPKRWRIGRTTTYAYKQAKTVSDIEDFIKK